MKTLALAAVVGLVLVLVCVGPAHGSFPGRNGRIAVERTNGSIWSVDPVAGSARRLTRAQGRCAHWFDEAPSYSASGRWIVYRHFDYCGPRYPDGIYMMRSDGRRRRLVLRDTHTHYYEDPALSPSSSRLAVVRGEVASDDADVVVLTLPGRGGARRVTGRSVGPQLAPTWSGAGRLALSLDSGIWMLRGRRPVRLTGSLRDGEPDWSPGGSRIVFQRYEQDWLTSNGDHADIFSVTVPGRGPRQLRRLTVGLRSFVPTFSPDGKQVAFVRAFGESKNGSLWLMQGRDGSGQRRILRNVEPFPISWQPLSPRRKH